MISIGDRLGIKEDIYALVTFDETGSQGDPMGRYHDQPVFPDRMDRAKVEQGGSYACMLYVPDGMNIYRAKVIEPVTMESISDESPEFKEDLARIAVERYPEALGSMVSEETIREIYRTVERRIEERLRASPFPTRRIAASSTMGSGIAIIHGTVLMSDRLEDGRYSVLESTSGRYMAVIPDDKGGFTAENRCLDLKGVLKSPGSGYEVSVTDGYFIIHGA